MEKQVTKNEILFKLIKKSLWGLAALFAAFWFVFSLGGNPYHEYLLVTKGITANGYITDVTKEVEPRDAGGYTYYYNYVFNFKLSNGQVIQSQQELSGGSPQETPDLSKPHQTEVVYLQDSPEINKLKNTLSDSIWEVVWRKIGLGILLLIMFSSVGFVLIRNAIKEYLTESKKLTTNLQ